MLFNSYVFIFLFLPIVLVTYYALNRACLYQTSKGWVVIASLIFYGYYNPSYCMILAVSIFVNYWIHLMLLKAKTGTKNSRNKILLIVGLVFNLGMLGYFKYMDFLIQNINLIAKSDFLLLKIALPLGISFFTFQQVSLIIDSYQGKTVKYSFLDYAVFVSFFPQLIAGPIVLHSEMIPQFQNFNNKKWNSDNMAVGIQYFVYGLSKKVLIADTFGKVANYGFEDPSRLNTPSAILIVLAYTLQIYFDFSGYCDMAMGLGKMFNINIPMNFNSPYKAITIADFWKRWHITLTRFFTTYVYIPLGGNQKGRRRTCMNVMIVFTISGLWHGADWSFVLWGMMHGLALVIYRVFRKKIDKIPDKINWLFTFCFVNFAWVFFRADFIRQALSVFKNMIFGGFLSVPSDITDVFLGSSITTIFESYIIPESVLTVLAGVMTVIWYAGTMMIVVKGKNAHELVREDITTRRTVWLVILAIVSIIHLSGVSTFLYFNF